MVEEGYGGTGGAALGRGLTESPIGPEGGAILEWRGPGRLAWEWELLGCQGGAR